MKELLKSAESLFGDSSSFEKFKRFCVSFIDEVGAYMKDNYDNWVKDTIENIESDEKPLR